MAPPSLKKSIQSYKSAGHRLDSKLEQLRQKQGEVEGRAFVVLDENTAQQNLEESPESYHTDVTSLVSTATNILMETTQLKLSYIREALIKLRAIHQETPKIPTPPELAFSRYEEWLRTNQRLFELNTQLYDLEKLKFELRQKHSIARETVKASKAQAESVVTGSQFVQSSVQRIQSFLTRFQFPSPSSNITRSYILELLNPRGDGSTVESQKVQEFISQCLQHKDDATIDPKVGAHPQNYHQFMDVLCSYIVEKQREFQGEELPKALVYSTVEQHVMPKIQSAVQCHIAQRERDEILHRQCEKYSCVTPEQLRIKTQLQSSEVVPFINSIAQLRASYFSPTPTDKMYAVVAAAKALYEQLGFMGETSIDGDSFLDLWIYVIIKANVKDLATNLCFMSEYGNPQLAIDEAGYYLTTLEAAVTFIETLTPNMLREPVGEMEFVVCECARFEEMQRMALACFEVVQDREPLPGYKVAIIQEWALNKARLFKTALVPTGCEDDIAVVSKIRILHNVGNTAHTQYFAARFTRPERDLEGLCCQATPLGLAVAVDLSNISPQEIVVLPSGSYDECSQKIEYVLQLIRLGSQGRDESHDACIIPSSSFQSTSASFVYIPSPRGEGETVESLRNRALQGESSKSSGISCHASPSRNNLGSPTREGYRELSSPYLLNLEPPAAEICMQDMPPSSHGSLPGKTGKFFKRLSQRSPTKSKKQPKEKKKKKAAHYLSTPVITTGYKKDAFEVRDGSSIGSLHASYRHPARPVIQVEVEVHDTHPSEGVEQISKKVSSKDHNTFLSPSANSSGARQRMASLQTPAQRGNNQRNFEEFGSGRTRVLSLQAASINNNAGFIPINGPDHTQSLLSLPASSSIDQSLQTAPSSGLSSIQQSSDFSTSYRTSTIDQFGGGDFDFESSVCVVKPHLASPQNILSDCYTEELEKNFCENHLYGDTTQSLSETIKNTVHHGQVYLQRLNYLSVTYKVDGVYCDTTLQAVRTFQYAHNKSEAQYSTVLPENGYLTATTFQYLRQAFLTVFASMMRMGLDKHLGPNFNPMSTSHEDIQLFRECVARFQTDAELCGCQKGSLCANTIDKIRHALRTKRYTF